MLGGGGGEVCALGWLIFVLAVAGAHSECVFVAMCFVLFRLFVFSYRKTELTLHIECRSHPHPHSQPRYDPNPLIPIQISKYIYVVTNINTQLQHLYN